MAKTLAIIFVASSDLNEAVKNQNQLQTDSHLVHTKIKFKFKIEIEEVVEFGAQ